jgi:hypothetical protein
VSDEGFRFEVSRFICASQKNNNPDHLMAWRIEGHFMVHRTDGAGGSMGQVGSGNAAICRAERCLPANISFARSSAHFLRRRQQRLSSAHDGSPGGPRDLSKTPDTMRY